MKIFYSQQGEDIYIYKKFINKICPDGVFVELGAMDGLIYSNTKFFEDELKMSGVLIEPTKLFNKLIINRPKCKCYNVAVNYTKDKVKFLGEHATAGIVDAMHPNFINAWHKNSSEYYVNGEPISNILKDSDIKYIDLMTIDVERGEEIVLKTLDFSIPIYIICIELDGHNTDKDERCRKILLNNGFIFDNRICINEFWINKNYDRKKLLYDDTQKFNIYQDDSKIQFVYLERHCVPDVEKALED